MALDASYAEPRQAEVELDTHEQYALMEDHTAPQATRRTEQALYLVDHGSGIGGIEVAADNLPISSTAYSWDGEQLLFHSDRLTDGLHALQVRATDNAGNVRALSFTTPGAAVLHSRFLCYRISPTRSTFRHPFPSPCTRSSRCVWPFTTAPDSAYAYWPTASSRRVAT